MPCPRAPTRANAAEICAGWGAKDPGLGGGRIVFRVCASRSRQDLATTSNAYIYACAEAENDGSYYWTGDHPLGVEHPSHAVWSIGSTYCEAGQEAGQDVRSFVATHVQDWGVFTWTLGPQLSAGLMALPRWIALRARNRAHAVLVRLWHPREDFMAKAAKRRSTAKAKKSAGRRKTAKRAKSSRRNGAARANGASRASGRDPLAIQMLKQDHRTVEELFEEFEEARRPSDKRAIAKEICLELTIHAMIEEEIFYPAVKDVIDEEIYSEAHVEHDGAKVLIAEIMAADPGDEFYDARVKVLSEMIKHHVKEEEQRDGMFAQAKSKGRDIDFDELAERLETRKEDLMRLMQRNGVPAPETRTLHGAKVKLGQPVA